MAKLRDIVRTTPMPAQEAQWGMGMGRIQNLVRKAADDYDKLPWYGQAALSANPITNVPVAMGQMDKYASMGDLKGMGITTLGAIFSPLKAAGIAGRGLLRSLSPVGIAANAADTAVELPKDKQEEWDLLREEQLRKEVEQKEAERQSWLRTRSTMDGVRG